MNTNGKISQKIIDVAVAVLRHGDKFLLATRHTHQHQGGKLEFVGGKIEQDESPKTALIREVREELGLDITDNVITKLGRICHDYPDKSVRLYVYQTQMSDSQYLDFKDKNIGLDGQAIGFYDKAFVLANQDKFPTANATILTWLSLPTRITISHPISHFQNKTDWLDCYRALPQTSTVLLRTKADIPMEIDILKTLSSQRDDLTFITSWQTAHHTPLDNIIAIRLTHDELFSLDWAKTALPKRPIIASCHDIHSIQKANELAKIHPVMAILLSPVLPTATHPDSSALGWDTFGGLAELSDVPVIALGGLCPSDVNIAHQHGAVAVAGIREFT